MGCAEEEEDEEAGEAENCDRNAEIAAGAMGPRDASLADGAVEDEEEEEEEPPVLPRASRFFNA